jgi:hypothetical protein
MRWYLDEECQTGDLVFFGPAHVALIVIHPDTGEPLVVERLSAGMSVQPARARMCDQSDVRVLPIAMPVPGSSAVDAVVDIGPTAPTSPALVSAALHRLAVLPMCSGASAAKVWRSATRSGAYGAPLALMN